MGRNIQKIFSEVPDTYQLVNHVLTLGMDILWRREAAAVAARQGGERWLDVCCGTGDMAANLSRLAPAGASIYAADFSLPMVGKARERRGCAAVRFVISDVKRLPFPDGMFDLVTISFATRNINLGRAKLIETMAEFRRVLKPGGRFINLETSQPPPGPLRRLFHLYVGLFVKPVGRMISGSRAGYAYLSTTIPRFYSAGELASIMEEAGFRVGSVRRLMFGAAAIHEGIKSDV